MTDTTPSSRPDEPDDDERPPTTIHLGSGSTVTVLATAAQTGGALSIYRWRPAASTRGPSPHFHTTFGETFIVEEGELDLFDGRAWRTLLPGEAAHAAPGEVHGLRKAHEGPATVLMILTPGVLREDYFAQLADADPHDMARLHQEHDNHFL